MRLMLLQALGVRLTVGLVLMERVTLSVPVMVELRHLEEVPEGEPLALGLVLTVLQALLVRLMEGQALLVRDTVTLPLLLGEVLSVPVMVELRHLEVVPEGELDTLAQVLELRVMLGLLLPLSVPLSEGVMVALRHRVAVGEPE